MSPDLSPRGDLGVGMRLHVYAGMRYAQNRLQIQNTQSEICQDILTTEFKDDHMCLRWRVSNNYCDTTIIAYCMAAM